MHTLSRTILALAVSGAALGIAPLAHADRYVVTNNYYGHRPPPPSSDYPQWGDGAPRLDSHYPQWGDPVAAPPQRWEHRRARRDDDDEDRYEHRRRPRVEYRYYAPPVIHQRVIVRPSPYGYGPAPGHYTAPQAYHSATPVVLGGIVGGMLGNRMGYGRGRDVATVAGVILGGSIARDLSYGR